MDKLDLIVHRIEDLKEATGDRLDRIDVNLAEHMRRTDVLEKLHRDNRAEIQELKKPKEALLFIKNAVLWVTAIIGAVLGIIRLMGK